MMSAVGAIVGLILAIVLIIRKFSPVYSLLLGAVVGGLIGGLGLESTVSNMISGVKDITPAIIRIIAAGVLSGVLIKTGAAASISHTIISKLGSRHIFLALALSTVLLTGVGVFIDVAVITVAPIAIIIADRMHHSGSNDYREAYRGIASVTVTNPALYVGDIVNTIDNQATVEMKRPMGKFKFVSTDVDMFIGRVIQMMLARGSSVSVDPELDKRITERSGSYDAAANKKRFVVRIAAVADVDVAIGGIG